MSSIGQKRISFRDLQTLFSCGTVGGLSDEQLLDRFVARREDAIFEEIIQRHGTVVWGVCRRVLRDHHDAEDAFQATFLVLARKAASVMPREKLGNWLYGVAYQTATKARATRLPGDGPGRSRCRTCRSRWWCPTTFSMPWPSPSTGS
jgi:hypothetical protein